MIVLGFSLRLAGVGEIGFAEDEVDKLAAVRAYDRGDFTADAEHPMLMKLLMDASMRAARWWSSTTGSDIAEEAALRFPNILFGALTAIPLFLLTAALFDRRTALLAGALWSFGVNAITYNRIGKEDTLMVFFMMFAFYFFIRAKQAHGNEQRRVNRLRNLSAVSFGLMMASKYFPHYLGLNMLYHHWFRMRERLYKNTVSSSPFWRLPLYFYLLFLATKVPIAILLAFVAGLFVSLRRWRTPGHGFVLFMLFFWLVPYSMFGAKWLRYTLSLMPFVYVSAAVGAVALVGWTAAMLKSRNAGRVTPFAAVAVLLFALVALPALTAYAGGPRYALDANFVGRGFSAYFFPHDEFYDDGLNEAILFVCHQAPHDAMIVSEAPEVVRYYTEKFGRTDLQSRVLSDPKFQIYDQQPAYYILQRGRTYFEHQDKMKEIRERFALVYAGCIKGHTAAEIYAVQPGTNQTVMPCGDTRP